MDSRILIAKNSVFESEFGLGANNPISLHTDSNHIYRSTGMDQIADIVTCGYVRTKGYGVRAKSRGEVVYWTRGGKVCYYNKQPIIETENTKLSNGQMGALPISDLTGIWMFDEVNNKYINKVDEYKKVYEDNYNKKMDSSITTPTGETVSYKTFLDKILPGFQDKKIMIEDREISFKDYFDKVVNPNIKAEDINYDNIMGICKELLSYSPDEMNTGHGFSM